MEDTNTAVRFLVNSTKQSSVEFLYAYIDDTEKAVLVCVQDGKSERRYAAHIGSTSAFDSFQKIKNEDDHAFAPEAFRQLMLGSSEEIPDGLGGAVSALTDLFATRPQRDVGGWATPFVLSDKGGFFVTYAYSVSDPRFKEWAPGSIIPHGTAEGGGATLSVTELTQASGTVIYWLQRPGGIVCRKTKAGYVSQSFVGEPSLFKQQVKDKLGFDVELWIGDQKVGPPNKIFIKRDILGNLETTIGMHGNALTFAVHNMTTPFKSNGPRFALDEDDNILPPNGVTLRRTSDTEIELALADEKISLGATDIDRLINSLAIERSNLYPTIPVNLKDLTCIADVDPSWRVDPNVHPGLPGAAT